jgi:hypothetical protein
MLQPRWLQILTAVLVALVLATSVAHVLELPAKLGYDSAFYVQLQTTLYQQWSPPGLAGLLEPVAIIAVLLLAMATRRNRPAFFLAVATALVLLVAFPLLYFWRVEPADEFFRTMAARGAIPADWSSWRMRWEVGQAARGVAHLVAFVLLMASLTQKPRRTRPVWLVV